jgi:tetratricopeptide (TPR) repeat protein
MPLEQRLIRKLEAALRLRRINEGVALLAAARDEIEKLEPDDPSAGRFMLLLAQWTDVGFSDFPLLRALLERFPPECRNRLPMGDYLRVRMAGAFIDLAREDPDSAIDALDSLLKIFQDIPDSELESLAHFWKGRAHRKKGEYEAALKHLGNARKLAGSDDKFFAAVIEIQESWLLFQKGLSKEAEQGLNRAESILSSTDHYVALANIESARGRIMRRAGEYGKALQHFAKAVQIYAKRDPSHANLARALVNAAYVRRLLALQLHKQIDAQARSGRTREKTSPRSSNGAGNPLVRYQKFWQEAVQDLSKAREIYASHANSDGLGKVLVSLAYLHLDRGDIENAAGEAGEAYSIAAEHRDRILMARARILQSEIENAHVEEQTGEDTDLGAHANRARQFSEEAQTLAQGTQNRRLQAEACLARGVTAANDFFQDWESARRFATEATGLIRPGESGHLVEDLVSLKSRIVRASGIDDMLRSWSEGIVGDKTFQQLAEDFAEIVIPKVWMREDRKISRVAAALSISPKKVRRILRNSGYIVA